MWSFEFDVRQPSILEKLLASVESVILVTVSFTVSAMDRKTTSLLFFNSNSTHQPTQVSLPEYETRKSGNGVGVKVGVGGGVKTGNAAKFPVTVAYSPHSQQKLPGESGF